MITLNHIENLCTDNVHLVEKIKQYFLRERWIL